MDTGTRRPGTTATRAVPFVPGVEGPGGWPRWGRTSAAYHIGDRVAWVYAKGSYAEHVVLPASAAVPVPGGISDESAAAVMMQGLSGNHFAAEAAPVQPGQTVLVHAAAGGLGQILVQLIKLRGARVIGARLPPGEGRGRPRGGADEVRCRLATSSSCRSSS